MQRLWILYAILCAALLTVAASAQYSTLAAQDATLYSSPTPVRTPTSTPVIPTLIPFLTPTLSGQVLTVTTLNDSDRPQCVPDDCSLREAVKTANWGATINFAPGLHGTIFLEKDGISFLKSVTINGPSPKSGMIVLSGGGHLPMFYISGGEFGTININNLVFVDGRGTQGAGLYNGVGAVANITNSTFKDDIADRGGATYIGGAIANYGIMTITNSTFQGNRSTGDGYAIDNEQTLTVGNSTFEGNGGGITNDGTLTISGGTFKNNNQNGFASLDGSVPITLRNSIVEGNPSSANCKGGIVDGGNNLQWPTNDCGASIPVGNPQLDLLSDNGGPTWTMALLRGSAARDKVKAGCPTADQRGAVLSGDVAVCDIGAFQHMGILPSRNPAPIPEP